MGNYQGDESTTRHATEIADAMGEAYAMGRSLGDQTRDQAIKLAVREARLEIVELCMAESQNAVTSEGQDVALRLARAVLDRAKR